MPLSRPAKLDHAVFVLPALQAAGLEKVHLRWLSRGSVRADGFGCEMFERVLGAVGIDAPASGLAAMRLWGQAGDRPSDWIAAADPVHFETRRKDLQLHLLGDAELSTDDISALIEHLQSSLGDDSPVAFVRVGRCGYIRAEEAMATARHSTAMLDGRVPDRFMPSGRDSAAHHRLISEIQMSLHEHDVNNRRMDAGLRPVNSMWIWGGGCAPEPVARAMPVLFSDDPLLRGIWHSCRGLVQAWSDSFDNMLDAAGTDCVAVCPDTASARSGTAMASYIAQLKNLATQRRPGKLTLIFRDGITVALRPADRFRFWRDIGPVLRDAAVQ